MLAELLELLHTGEDRWDSLEADVHERQDRDGLRAVADRASAAFFGSSPTRRPPGSPPADDGTGTEEWTLSVTATSRRAVRVARQTEGGRAVLIVGADGGILHVDEHGVADTEPNPLRSVPWIRLGLLAPMLAPAMLAGACRLRVTGTTVVASRECIGAVAVMRPEATDLVQNLLGFGVRRAELAVDRFTGVVLRIQTTDDDEHPLHRLEAHSVRFDVPSTATRSPPNRVSPRSGRGP